MTLDLKAGLAYKKMALFIRRVCCLEETDEIGSDAIAMGGTVTDALGNTGLVKEFTIDNDFDEGEQKDFGWSMPICSWNLQTKNEGFPYVYASVAFSRREGRRRLLEVPPGFMVQSERCSREGSQRRYRSGDWSLGWHRHVADQLGQLLDARCAAVV
jgi:hypothetical protein